MSIRTPILIALVVLFSLLGAATTQAQQPPRPTDGHTPSGPAHPNNPGGYGTPATQTFEEFTIRLEPALGSPRCPKDQADGPHCEPVGWLSTRSQNFVNIMGEAYLRGTSIVPQGVQMTSSFVASQNDTNVAIQFSAEAYVDDDVDNAFRRLFVRVLVDGQAANPSNVVFATTEHEGVQAFVFTTNVNAGIHTVEMQWKVDSEATAFVRDASLLVRMGRDEESAKGTLTVKTAPSGLNQTTSSQAWNAVPDMGTAVYVPKNGQVTATFSAEAYTSKGKRMMLRAVIDGAPMDPGDVIFANNGHPSSQSMTFGIQNVSQGWHNVQVQWFAEAGGNASVGDRTLVVSALPVKGDGGSHYFVAAPSGPSIYSLKEIPTLLPLDDMSIDFSIPAKGNGEVAVQFSAEIDATGDAVAIAALVVDGEVQLDGLVQMTDGSQPAQVKSFVFEAKGLKPGEHTAEIWFASGNTKGQAYVGDRTMSLMSETGFIPDLAEAPKFSGGHIDKDNDYIAGIEPLIGSRKVLAILLDPEFCDANPNPAPGVDLCYNQYTVSKGKVESAIFGTSPQPGWGAFQPDNIASYYTVNSGGRFTIARAGLGIAGWYSTDKNWKSYYQHDGSCIDNYDDGGAELHAEALRHADGSVNFASYDVDGDGELTTQELAIVIVIPREDGDGSAIVPIYGSTCGANTRLELDGVLMPSKAAKWNTSLDDVEETRQFTTGAHELLHLIGGLDDLYVGTDVSTNPANFSLMADNRWTSTHLDPFQKLAFGWVTPVRIEQTGAINVNVVAKSNTVYVMPRYNNPWEEEFFIVENRKEGMGFPWFDDEISDSGIGVWHIVSDRKENQMAPIGTTQAKWDASHIPSDNPNSGGQMGRNGIRLIRPFDDLANGTAVFSSTDHKMWDKGDYPLESGGCFQIVPLGEAFKNKLAWADCKASGYSLRFMDWSQETMQVMVNVN